MSKEKDELDYSEELLVATCAEDLREEMLLVPGVFGDPEEVDEILRSARMMLIDKDDHIAVSFQFAKGKLDEISMEKLEESVDQEFMIVKPYIMETLKAYRALKKKIEGYKG